MNKLTQLIFRRPAPQSADKQAVADTEASPQRWIGDNNQLLSQ